jgi:DNA-binding transcriptional regulator LsrR (DeoR family)
MPTLREMIDFIRDCAETSGRTFSEDFAETIERQIQARYPAERVYIPPADSRKNGRLADKVADAGRTLPTGIIAERFGISRRHAARLCKK